MALTIDATAGSATGNSFVLESEAITFAATRLNLTGWTTVTGTACTESEKAALIEASRELSAVIYQGYRTDGTQTLAWPRQLAVDPDRTSSYYVLFDSNVIPQRIKNAACELAFQFLADGTTDTASLDSTISIKSESVGPISTTYAEPSQRAQGLARYPRVMRQIAPLLAIGSGQTRLIR